VPALQVQNPEFKLKSHEKNKKRKRKMQNVLCLKKKKSQNKCQELPISFPGSYDIGTS
jgi:hypothetical protein